MRSFLSFRFPISSWLSRTMSAETAGNKAPVHGQDFDDQIQVLTQQLEEIHLHEKTQKKGKYPEDHQPPDHDLAFSAFEDEVLARIAFIKGLKLVNSIGQAITSDEQVIADILQRDTRA